MRSGSTSTTQESEETRKRFAVRRETRASTITLILVVPAILILFALPAFASRVLLQELFYVFTMLSLAQLWNLLAGSAGLISVGQQAFVGVGAYALFAFTVIVGLDFVRNFFAVRGPAARDMMVYWLALLLALGTFALVYRLLRSRHGLALSALGDSETAAESTGVDVFRTMFLIYALTAVATGMVGALIFLQKARISPDAAFSLIDWTAYVIFIVVIGGIGSMEGPIIGVAIFYLLQYYLAALGSWYLMLLGALAIILMLFAPSGIWGVISHSFDISLFPVRRKLVATTGSSSDKDGKP